MERLVGELQGQMQGIQQSQNRIERDLEENTQATKRVASDVVELSKQISEIQVKAKFGWKVLTGIAAAASVGGASAKHFLEVILSGLK